MMIHNFTFNNICREREREEGRQRDIDYSQQHLLENHSISSSSTLRRPGVISLALSLGRFQRSKTSSSRRCAQRTSVTASGTSTKSSEHPRTPRYKKGGGKKSSWEIKAGIGVEFCFPDLSARVSYLYLSTFWNRSSLEARSPLWNRGLTSPLWSSYALP